MNTLWQVPVVVAALLTWLSAPPDTLADAADREALRRQLTGKATHLYTNVDLVPAAADAAASPGAPPAAAAASEPGVPAPEPEGNQPEVRDEAWWRGRVASIRTSIERNEILLKSVQSRINGLTTDIVSRDDPFQRQELRAQLQKALAEFDRVQSAIVEYRQSLEALRVDARRAGALPGWLR